MVYVLTLFTLLLLVLTFKQRGQLKRFLEGSRNVEEFINKTERLRREELHSKLLEESRKLETKLEETKLKMEHKLEEERQTAKNNIREEELRLREELEIRRSQIDKDLESKRDLFKDELHLMSTEKLEKSKELKKEFEIEAKKIEEDKALIKKTLDELKLKRSCTLEALKEEEKGKNELDFKKINFSKSDSQDIAQLKKVEKLINNKDVLRKLIYKTYVESPMNEMFNRIGAKTEPGIYKIENIIDGRVYIGQSVNVRNRLRDHIKSALGISTIANQAVHSAMNEEGLENFFFQVLTSCGREDLNEMEKYWIDYYKSGEWGYNRTRGGS